MTSMKTPNTSIQSKKEEKNNSFFVSDSIKHLLSEETFLKPSSTQDDLPFVRSDMIAKVHGKKDHFIYCDIISYTLKKLIRVEGTAQLFKFFHESKINKIEILLKNESLDINLNCNLLQFDEIRPGAYIYTLGILEKENEEK